MNGGMTILFLGKWPMFWSSQSWKRLMYWWHGALWQESKDQDAKCHKYIQWCSCFLIWQRTVIQSFVATVDSSYETHKQCQQKNTRSQNSLIFNCSARHVVCTKNQRQNWNRKTSKHNSNSFILRLHNVPTESRLLLTATIWRTPQLKKRQGKPSVALWVTPRFFFLLLHNRIKPRKQRRLLQIIWISAQRGCEQSTFSPHCLAIRGMSRGEIAWPGAKRQSSQWI